LENLTLEELSQIVEQKPWLVENAYCQKLILTAYKHKAIHGKKQVLYSQVSKSCSTFLIRKTSRKAFATKDQSFLIVTIHKQKKYNHLFLQMKKSKMTLCRSKMSLLSL